MQTFQRRALVLVEDHAEHLDRVVDSLESAVDSVAADVTFVCLDRRGPDTDEAVLDWRHRLPRLQVAAFFSGMPSSFASDPELIALDDQILDTAHLLARTVASFLRPGGTLFQDIQLSTLRFLAGDRWWESIYGANTVRGLFPDRPPRVRFVSNKREFHATFGSELMQAGFDPRDVLDKDRFEAAAAETLLAELQRSFPWRMRAVQGCEVFSQRVAADGRSRGEVEEALDVVVWPPSGGRLRVGGRAFECQGIALKADGSEAATWEALVHDRLVGGPGVPVTDVGARVAPAGALRAEITNSAARHVYALRRRLAQGDALLNRDHRYHLSDRLAVARVLAPGASEDEAVGPLTTSRNRVIRREVRA